MLRTRLICLSRLLSVLAICVVSLTAVAQDAYPSRPIRVVVPYGPGGGSDLLARQVSEKLAKVIGVAVLVENRPGADGNAGASYVAREPADGYTLFFSSSALLVNHVMGTTKGFSYTDLSPLALVASAPFILVINPATPANNVAELVAYSKKNPGVLNYSSAAISTSLLMELFKQTTSIDATNIQYRSGSTGLTAVIANRTHMMLASALPVKGFLAEGRLKAIAIASEKRLPLLPDVPTFREQGFDFQFGPWWGFVVSAKTPAPIVAKLESAIHGALVYPGLQDTITSQGLIGATGDKKSFLQFIDSEAKLWQKVKSLKK